MAVRMDQGDHVLSPLKGRLFVTPTGLPVIAVLPPSGGFAVPTTPAPPSTSLTSPRRASAFGVVISANAAQPALEAPPKSGDVKSASAATSSTDASKDEENEVEGAAGMVPNQLSAFPLFGGSGVPQTQSNTNEPTEEDLTAWQPVFSSSMAVSPRGTNGFGAAGVGAMAGAHLGFPGHLFTASSLLSPRAMMGETLLDPSLSALDVSRTTFIPRLNLDAINLHPTGALFTGGGSGLSASSSSSSFAAGATGPATATSQFEFTTPLSPTTLPSQPSSGRLSRLSSASRLGVPSLSLGGGEATSSVSSGSSPSSASPFASSSSSHVKSHSHGSSAMSHAHSQSLGGPNSPPHRRYTYGGPPSSTSPSPSSSNIAGSGSPLSPRAIRVKSARESAHHAHPDSNSDFTVSPVSSARGKRRRSIFEDETPEDNSIDEEESTQGDYIGTYVPTVSSARQKKKRALAANQNNNLSDSSSS